MSAPEWRRRRKGVWQLRQAHEILASRHRELMRVTWRGNTAGWEIEDRSHIGWLGSGTLKPLPPRIIGRSADLEAAKNFAEAEYLLSK